MTHKILVALVKVELFMRIEDTAKLLHVKKRKEFRIGNKG